MQRWRLPGRYAIKLATRDMEVDVSRKWLGLLAAGCIAGASLAQDNDGAFGGFKHDRTQPIDITADFLEVRQAEQLAIFTGNVIAGQDTLRLTADRVEVTFDEDAEGNDETGAIKNLKAKGNVFLNNGAETAEGNSAEYDVESGIVTMVGDVVLTQGESGGTGESLEINLNTGVAKMKGRVSLSFQRNSAPAAAAKPKCTKEQEAAAKAAGLKCVPLESTN